MPKIKTKIIATIGPATLNYRVFQAMLKEGIDFIRINTSYGSHKQYDQILDNLKRADHKKKIRVILDIKNLKALSYAKANNIKHIALSFAENTKQIETVRKALPGCFVISKIETRIGVKNFEKILEASDGIMIARGDLSYAVSLENVPPLQKDFTYRSLDKKKFVITATEMLLSMVNNSKPTRAEVSDVANAVFDGSNAVMLSEETTIGKHPVAVVRIMRKIIAEAEKWGKKMTSARLLNRQCALK
ncbi:MAG: pyruvate kinase [Patescibacteria group bacterium]